MHHSNFKPTSFHYRYKYRKTEYTLSCRFNFFSYLHLVRADVELVEDVAEEVLDFGPGVDAVGTVHDNNDVHECLAFCRTEEFTDIWLVKVGLCSLCFFLPQCVCVCKCAVTLLSWSNGLSRF